MSNTIYTKSLAATIAYLIGVSQDKLDSNYGEECRELLDSLKEDKSATIIRYLCRLKTQLMYNYRITDMQIRNNLMNLDRLEYYDKDEIKWLEKNDISIIKANHKAEDYIDDISQLINKNFPACKPLFEDWVNFDYISALFCVSYTSKSKKNFFKGEFAKFMEHYKLYPYQMYIYWTPLNEGNILYNDGKFLDILYRMHGEEFTDSSKYKNANEDLKKNIYDFIHEAEKVSLVVDCENSDVFKLYSVLKNLDADEVAKINDIILYDDYHTTKVWNMLHKRLHIPVEHIDVERVTDRKSLVDIKLAVGVCKEYYTNNTDSFILVSSDSDYWGLISSLPDARFLVMYEYDKCGYEIRKALEEKQIFSCSIDDFCSAGNTEDFK